MVKLAMIHASSQKRKKEKNVSKKIFSYLTCYQIWLNFYFMYHCHFGYNTNLKKKKKHLQRS
jgi:hypothetical protein